MTTPFTPSKVAVGQDTPWGVATPFCAMNLSGRWACAVHGVAEFADRSEMVAHYDDLSDGPHLMVWRCREDGEVHGWAR
jgi:hypothetical protein